MGTVVQVQDNMGHRDYYYNIDGITGGRAKPLALSPEVIMRLHGHREAHITQIVLYLYKVHTFTVVVTHPFRHDTFIRRGQKKYQVTNRINTTVL